MPIVPPPQCEPDYRAMMVYQIAQIVTAAIIAPENIDAYTLAEKIASEAVDEYTEAAFIF